VIPDPASDGGVEMNFRRIDIASVPVVLLLVLFLLLPPHLLGAVVPGNWSKVENLEPNTRVFVHLKWGERLEGLFIGLEPTSIQVKEGVHPKNSIRIEKGEYEDP